MLSFYIGLRYTLSRQQSHLVAFISRVSMAGMVLAVSLLITVMSVMNGFDSALKERILALVPHATVSGFKHSDNWRELLAQAKKHPQVESVEPYSMLYGLLMNNNHIKQSLFLGVDPDYIAADSALRQLLNSTDLSALQASKSLILGYKLAEHLGLDVGQTVQVLLPMSEQNLPRSEYFTLQALLRSGTELDQKMVLMHRENLALLQDKPRDSVDGLSIYVRDIFKAREVARELSEQTQLFYVKDWTQSHGNLYQAIQMSRSLVLLLVFIIIAVAAFNVVSTLVLAVNDKKGDIAILRTMGCNARQIMGIFFVQGAVIGFLGAFIGALLGCFFSYFIGDAVALLEGIFDYHFLQTEVYPIEYLPSDLQIADVIVVALVAQGLSILASVFPALRAIKLQPADVLRYQ